MALLEGVAVAKTAAKVGRWVSRLWKAGYKKAWFLPALVAAGIVLTALFFSWRIAVWKGKAADREVALVRIVGERDTSIEALRGDVKKHEIAYEKQGRKLQMMTAIAERTRKSKERWRRIAADGSSLEYERDLEERDTDIKAESDEDRQPVLPEPVKIPGITPEPADYNWTLAGDYALTDSTYAGTLYRIWRPWFATGLGVGGPDLEVTGSALVMMGPFGASYAISLPEKHRIRATYSF